MRPMTLMATGNINCPLLGVNPEFPRSFNFNPPSPSSLVQDMGPGTARSDRTDNNEAYATQELRIEVFDNIGINPPTGLLNNNPNPIQRIPGSLNNVFGLNENILQWSNENYIKPHGQLNMMDSVIPEEQLTVNIDTDEGGTHSWRPNLTNSLCSDFFLAQPDSESAAVSQSEQLRPMPQLFIWDSQVGKETAAPKPDSQQVMRNSYSEVDANYPRMDIPSHLQSQRTQLNCLKYEIINAKRKLHESQATVSKLECELEEKLLFQNSKDKQRLRDENAELRLECQCLCMEVDFYLKGKAPLGEIDETFYRGNASDTSKPDVTEAVQPQIVSEQLLYNSEEQEEANKWECPKCTFANHPAINSCEMCHMTRGRRETTPLLPPSSKTCYCHPKEHNFS